MKKIILVVAVLVMSVAASVKAQTVYAYISSDLSGGSYTGGNATFNCLYNSRGGKTNSVLVYCFVQSMNLNVPCSMDLNMIAGNGTIKFQKGDNVYISLKGNAVARTADGEYVYAQVLYGDGINIKTATK